jgi:hypothetical protein
VLREGPAPGSSFAARRHDEPTDRPLAALVIAVQQFDGEQPPFLDRFAKSR